MYRATLPGWQPSKDAKPLTEEMLVDMARSIKEGRTIMVGDQDMKKDLGKPLIHLVNPGFILGLAEVLTFGAAKYEEDGWMKGISFRRIVSAMGRHMIQILLGNMVDDETGFLHIYHVAANVMFLAHYLENRWVYREFDDLPFDVTRAALGDKADTAGIPTVDNGLYDKSLQEFLGGVDLRFPDRPAAPVPALRTFADSETEPFPGSSEAERSAPTTIMERNGG